MEKRFFSRLFQYQAHLDRAPAEDFLTEVLAEWLRQLTAARQLPQVLTTLFSQKLPPELSASVMASVQWTTQHIIGPGHRGTGKRADLVGQGTDFFLIVENKISAAFSVHEDESGTRNQLETYAEYRMERPERYGSLVLLTHYTSPPDGWDHPVVRWQDIHMWCFERLKSHHSDTRVKYFTRLLKEFLEDQNMTGTRIELSEIVAIPAYDSLTQGCRNLGLIASQVISDMDRATNRCSLKRPQGGGSGGFSNPNYFGEVRTPNGVKPDDVDMILWCGILAKPAYEIEPRTTGIPELSVGIAFWETRSELAEDVEEQMQRITSDLNKATNDMGWRHKIIRRPEDPDSAVGFIRTDRSFIDIYHQASGEFWDESVGDFLKIALKGIKSLHSDDIQRFLDCFK